MKKLRLLVVDDCHELARSLAQLLERWGHHVTVATDGRRALEAAAAARFDAAILDLELPGMSGFEIAEQLRQQPAHQPILLVAVTGQGEPEYRRRAAEAGFDHFLTKPATSSQLEVLLRCDANGVRG